MATKPTPSRKSRPPSIDPKPTIPRIAAGNPLPVTMAEMVGHVRRNAHKARGHTRFKAMRTVCFLIAAVPAFLPARRTSSTPLESTRMLLNPFEFRLFTESSG
jgi:hypothetical protein